MYLIFDIETVRDDDLIFQTCKELQAWDGLTPTYETKEQCLERMERVICDEQGDDCFWPLKFVKPVLVSFIALDGQLNYITHRSIFGTDPQKLTAEFWQLIEEAPTALSTMHYVSFNGKRFDIPVMEVQALRYALSCPWWFRMIGTKSWEDPRSTSEANAIHYDIFQKLSTTGRTGGGLDYWSKLMGLPGKVETKGNAVEELYAAGDWDAIQDYCLCDVLNTAGLLMGLQHAHNPYLPGPRSDVFEKTLTTIMSARQAEGTTSKELERYWKLYGPEIPF